MLESAAQSKTPVGGKAEIPADDRQLDQCKPPETPEAAGLAPVQQQAAESRQDPITGTWTVFAPQREQRPDEFQTSGPDESAVKVDCPFCVGSEAKTPPAVWVGKLADSASGREDCREPSHLIYRGGNAAQLPTRDWSVRVVPNRFPAITPIRENGTKLAGNAPRESNLVRRRVIRGGHEVIIEAPRHVRSITELDLAEVSLLFAAYRDRIAHWHQTQGIAYITVFKNVGGQAGASLTHSHSQLIAADIIPSRVKLIADRLAKYRARTGCCMQCDIIRGELKEESRVIAKSESVIAYCPFASPMPMMARITSLEHLDRFDQLGDRTLGTVSRLVSRVVSWLEKLHPGTAYNMLLHSAPPGIKNGGDTFHWSIDLFPRLSRIAGFEFSTDSTINPMMPEIAAKRYRDCGSAEDPRLVL